MDVFIHSFIILGLFDGADIKFLSILWLAKVHVRLSTSKSNLQSIACKASTKELEAYLEVIQGHTF